MASKAGDFKGYKKYYAAHQAALDVVNQIEALTNKYASNQISLTAFKSQAKVLFDDQNPSIKQLQTHRGWKEILVNVLAAIIGNVFFLAAAACAGTFTLFKPATDSANKVNALARAVNKVVEDEEEEENLDLAALCQC